LASFEFVFLCKPSDSAWYVVICLGLAVASGYEKTNSSRKSATSKRAFRVRMKSAGRQRRHCNGFNTTKPTNRSGNVKRTIQVPSLTLLETGKNR
ncbi:MAG: hypothetical protein ACF8AM_15895, partial [Rhodopirellula sp. JB055]|uniref:hypothetical protein n=1 Tax=Rhodopirellula sp. JB055 TaxID=3342846 RepID=UPI00370B98FD